MRVKIETKDQLVIQNLQPLIEVAQNYDGHFNASYHHKNSDLIVFDNLHKKRCYELLAKANQGFIIGSGGSHIWVAKHTATAISFTSKVKNATAQVVPGEPLAINGIHDRVLLIIDEN